MIFETTLSGVSHRYEITEEGLLHSTAGAAPARLAWSELKQITPGRNGTVRVLPQAQRGRKLPKITVWLDSEKMPAFLDALFETWGRHHRGVAAKAAFDYSSNSRPLGWIWVFMSLLFPGLLAALLLTDGLETLSCNKLLANGKIANAEVLKIKKNRRGNFTWDLVFTTEAGQKITGRRTAFVHTDKGMPTSELVTVVYTPARESCWDVSLREGENAPNYRQRHHTMILTLGLGISFAVFTLIGLAIGISTIRRRHPFADTVKNASARLIGGHQP